MNISFYIKRLTMVIWLLFYINIPQYQLMNILSTFVRDLTMSQMNMHFIMDLLQYHYEHSFFISHSAMAVIWTLFFILISQRYWWRFHIKNLHYASTSLSIEYTSWWSSYFTYWWTCGIFIHKICQRKYRQEAWSDNDIIVGGIVGASHKQSIDGFK